MRRLGRKRRQGKVRRGCTRVALGEEGGALGEGCVQW